MTTFAGLCARLLRDEALEAGLDPFATPVSAADRLAMLLERIDELPLRHHDLRGNPSATLGAIVRRIDRLKEELISARDYAAWATTLPEDARGAREREFADLYAAHDALLGDAGALDAGDLVLTAFRLLRDQAARAGPAGRAPPPRAGGRAAGHELRPGPAAAAARLRATAGSPRSPTTTRRSTASAVRPTKNIRDFRAEWPAATVRAPGGLTALRRTRAGGGARGGGADRGPAREGAGAARRRARRRGGVLALRLRARPGPGRRGRCRAAGRPRGRRAGGRVRARALRTGGGTGGGRGVRGASGSVPPVRRGGVLPARRGARPARLAAAARRPRRRRRGRARARPAAGRAAGHRPRPGDADRPPAQARHGRGAHGGPGVAADPARGARADRHLPEALPRGGGGAGLHAAGPVRAPAGRAARAAPSAAVRGLDRGGRAPAEPRPVRRAGGVLRAALAAGHGAGVRPGDRRGGGRGPARGGGDRPRVRARRAGDDHARRQGPRVRPRVRPRA